MTVSAVIFLEDLTSMNDLFPWKKLLIYYCAAATSPKE